MKKLLAVTIMILFISVSVIPSTGSIVEKKSTMPIARGDTLYVGGSGPGNYTSIQDAIDDANDGDTVFVYNGTYYEHVIINKSINLIGKDKNSTIIDGNKVDDVVNITADYVTVSSFTLQNSGNRTIYYISDSGVDLRANYSIVTNNIFISNYGIGIYLLWANNNVISNNILIDNEYSGIELSHYSCNNSIINNSVKQSHNAIYLGIKCKNNTIKNNIVSYCELAGINFYWDCHNNIVSGNTITNNYRDGIWLHDSSNNRFLHNNFIMNFRNVYFSDCTNKWKNNYWGRPRFFPKLIFGRMRYGEYNLLWVQVDWHPASEPYDIGV